MMIGGGGSSCRRADHGIGITEAAAASFVTGESCTGAGEYEHDFGYGSNTGCTTQSQTYSLNLWIH